MKTREQVSVTTPEPGETVLPEHFARYYALAQEMMRDAIGEMGLANGSSAVLSGLTRELRRHMSITAAQDALHGLADTMPQAARFDMPDVPNKTN